MGNYCLGMAVAALLISIFSILVALIAAYFTYQQARFTRQQAQVDADRRREERGPVFKGEVESLGSWYRLRLRLQSPWPLRSLAVDIVDGERVSFTHNQNGVDSSSPTPIRVATYGALQPGGSATWRVQLEDDGDTHLRLRVLAYGAAPEEEWTRPLSVELPNPLGRLIA
jgi:hypothetical protein